MDYLAITLRHGAADDDRELYPVSWEAIERLARDYGATVVRKVVDRDQLDRGEVSWTQMALTLPDDGTGALPLLRHVILHDSKSSTYKLALLRVLCRIADSTAGTAQYQDDETVSVPLGLVALYWLRLFKPLLQADLPQSPTNRGMKGLGFAGAGFRALSGVSHLDLRIGSRFAGETAQALQQALKEAVKTITTMPVHYMTDPSGSQILRATRYARLLTPTELVIDPAYLASFGQLLIPQHLWLALLRFEVWIEPALIAEWIRLMKGYATSQKRSLNEADIALAMTWSDPSRDVTTARQRAIALLDSQDLFCVWSGKRLSERSLDIDHCFPWSAWACDDFVELTALGSRGESTSKARSPSQCCQVAVGSRPDARLVGGSLSTGAQSSPACAVHTRSLCQLTRTVVYGWCAQSRRLLYRHPAATGKTEA